MVEKTSKIRILSEQTINVIAAGEVVENPSLALKELIENALDAGASRLEIECEEGGFKRLRVSDNGCGMGPDDALLSLERHATSKIRNPIDLESLMTLGFRGEALASIAAISKLTLTTADQPGQGTRIEVVGGKILSATPFTRDQGTTIEVRSLFYNVPARKKFQKSSRASQLEITKTATLLSLARPDIGFDVKQEGKTVLDLPSINPSTSFNEQLSLRAKQLFGSSFSQNFLVSTKSGEFELQGLISQPGSSRPSRSSQYLFINQRPIYSLSIASAVKEGYGTLIAEKQHPPFVLHLFLPPDQFDVNVHPQKKEVRFQNERMIKEKIISAVREALGQTNPIAFEKELPWEKTTFPLFLESKATTSYPPSPPFFFP